MKGSANMYEENFYNTKLYEYADGSQIRRYKRHIRKMSEAEKERRKALIAERRERERQLSEKGEQYAFDSYLSGGTDVQASQLTLDLLENAFFDSQRNRERSLQVSVNRSLNSVYQIARANIWDYFVTITFNPDIVDSTDYSAVTHILSGWLNAVKHTYAPDMKYLFVPELHTDGRKYHFHGLISQVGNLPLVDSGRATKEGNVIYNIANYRFGFTTATRVGDSAKACGYLVKYLTKELSCSTPGKKRYWCSKNVCRPVVKEFNFNDEEFKQILDDNVDYLATAKSVDVYIDNGQRFNHVSYYEMSNEEV